MNIYIAPVQGHTDAAWRHFHKETYGGDNKYFTPFMRLEHSEIRMKDLRDFHNPLNDTIDLEPQVIFSNVQELEIMMESLVNSGVKAVNLNMGCPFPLQTKKGRGAGFISNISEAERIPELLTKYPDVRFSIKMRLGMEDPDEWKSIMEILNSIVLDTIYVHPRVARQQYKGDLFLDRFGEILDKSTNPVVFNGEIKTPYDIKKVYEKFPGIKGIMIARGILGRPSLAAECEDGEWPRDKRIEKMKQFHKKLLQYYRVTLCGDVQILAKIKPFWEFTEDEIGRKAWKELKKATKIEKYIASVAKIE